MKKLLKIKIRGETIIANGRVVRTPVDIKLTDDEFNRLKPQLRSKGITEEHYSFGPLVQHKPSIINTPELNKEPIVEEINLPENLSYLQKLAEK